VGSGLFECLLNARCWANRKRFSSEGKNPKIKGVEGLFGMTGKRKLWQKRREHHIARVRSEIERLQNELISLGAERVILFGSAAREELGLGSDIDLIVVMKSALNFVERTGALYKILQPRLDADILAYTPEEFERVSETSPLVRLALIEGKELSE
jgi:predicted nucleotidyltransferase